MVDLELRYVAGDVRADAEAMRRIDGHAVVFNERSVDLGGFTEIILPQAVDRTLREALDVRALVDHESSKVIGRTRAGTLTLRKDKKGLRVDIDTADTTAGRDILVSVRRGDVSGMSFAFRVMPNGDEWREEDGMLIREVHDMTIREVSIVSFPAYTQTDVSVAKRSLAAFQQTHAGSRVEWLRKQNRLRRAR
jgi:HK97 family phage prohead protease